MSGGDPDPGREIIFEFQSVGDSVRVAAVDVATGEEVVISGPASTPQADLERIAARKLARRLQGREDPESKTPRRGGRGVII
ncbi:serine hydroxymethyltransferase [Marinicauda salina]|uniref:Serine hydroxymethyltransferase n=1 Tax=Marinicauda salina TaxID=2135793 RepID=A0A2U2BVF4_9PROT|nr:serine hydroxymethyltransferase [Marinicauda salina]PWE17982.1 serine hydroxymethyltransferase [Marinicauda salina]